MTHETTCEIGGIAITYHLPDWCGGEEGDWEEPRYYPQGHMWAGSFSHHASGNWHVDELFGIDTAYGRVAEVCNYPEGKWLVADFYGPVESLGPQVQAFRKAVDAKLAEIRAKQDRLNAEKAAADAPESDA